MPDHCDLCGIEIHSVTDDLTLRKGQLKVCYGCRNAVTHLELCIEKGGEEVFDKIVEHLRRRVNAG